jgi:uncharacterized phage protein (TIGR02218 family)
LSKNISTVLKAHLAQSVTTMTSCWRVERLDGAIFGFTTLDQDIVFEGVTYQSTVGFSRTAIALHVTGEISNLDVLGFFDAGGIVEQDLRNGKFDFASVYLFGVNWADLTQAEIRLSRGYLGECIRSPSGAFQAELRGLTQALVQEFANVWSPLCRADLGDTKCQFPILSLSQIATVTAVVSQRQFQTTPLAYNGLQLGNTASIFFVNNISAGTALEISDGINTVTFTALFDQLGSDFYATVLAGLPSGLDMTASGVPYRIDLVNNSGQQGIIQKTGDNALGITIEDFTEFYLDNGTITWETGLNAGVSMEMKTYLVAGQYAILWLAMKYPIQIGDQYRYQPGCDKRRDTCENKFANILNMRAEPDMPGTDVMLAYPDST